MLTSGLAWRVLSRSGEKCTGVSLEDKRQLRMANAVEPLERDVPDLWKTCSVVAPGGFEGPWPIILGIAVCLESARHGRILVAQTCRTWGRCGIHPKMFSIIGIEKVLKTTPVGLMSQNTL